ncbi:MAG: hypothetical protein ENTA_05121 [Enterocloster clostridioformis]
MADMNEALGRELGWDDQIENDGADYEPLPDGEYDFEVRTMERGRFAGSDKMAACNKATIDCIVKDAEGKEHHVYDDLILNSKMEWKLCQFFLCIGQRAKGEKLKPRWNEVVGSTGRFKIYLNEYTDRNGKPRRNNKVDEYLAPQPKQFKAGDF